MTQYLPPILLTLFYPREPIPFLPQIKKKPPKNYGGISKYLGLFEDPSETPQPVTVLSKDQIKQQKKAEMDLILAQELQEKIAGWNPKTDPNTTEDPLKTIFVAKLNYDTSESKLKREMEAYGPVKKVSIVTDINTGRSRGYAFVEFEDERDMKSAYKRADGKKIDGRRIIVDLERGRTVKNWLPRRLGGGLGGEKRQDLKKSPLDFDSKSELDETRSERKGGRDRSVEQKYKREKPRSRSRDRKERHSSKHPRGRSVEKDRKRDQKDREYRDRDRNDDERPSRSSHRHKESFSSQREEKQRRGYSPRESRMSDEFGIGSDSRSCGSTYSSTGQSSKHNKSMYNDTDYYPQEQSFYRGSEYDERLKPPPSVGNHSQHQDRSYGPGNSQW